MKIPLLILILLGVYLILNYIHPFYLYLGWTYISISILWITINLVLSYKKIKIDNLFLGLVEQLPLKRAFRNFFITGNAWGLFSIRSHQREDGKLKVMYNTKVSATKAAESMAKKMNKHFSVYKCIYCDGYHLGKNRENK
jgi:hypothetical protein